MASEGHKGEPEPHSSKKSLGMHLFKRKTTPRPADRSQEENNAEKGNGQEATSPAGKRVTPGIQPDGESGRSWFHPLHFFRICWASSSHVSKWTNLFWPFTIAALVLHFNYGHLHMWVFITAYIGMIPAANLVGFAGQELARKIPKVLGVILETTFGSIVEIILFMVLITGGNRNVPVIQAAILGSILANLLLCLGALNTYLSLCTLTDKAYRLLFLHRRHLLSAADLPRSNQRSG